MMKQPDCSCDSATSVKRSALQLWTRQSSAILEKTDIAPMKRLYRDGHDNLTKYAARLSISHGTAVRIDAPAGRDSGRKDDKNSAPCALKELVGVMLITSQTFLSPSASMRRRGPDLRCISTTALGRTRQSFSLVRG